MSFVCWFENRNTIVYEANRRRRRREASKVVSLGFSFCPLVFLLNYSVWHMVETEMRAPSTQDSSARWAASTFGTGFTAKAIQRSLTTIRGTS